MSFISKSHTGRQFVLNESFTYFWVIYHIVKLQNCTSLDSWVIATKMSKCLLSLKVCNQTLNLSLLHVPPSHKKIYIPLSLVHLIYTAGDKCMRQNACFNKNKILHTWRPQWITRMKMLLSVNIFSALNLNLDLSPFVKSAPVISDNCVALIWPVVLP